MAMKSLLSRLFDRKWRCAAFLLPLLTASTLLSIEGQNGLKKSAAVTDTTIAASKMIDVNNMAMWVQNNGLFASDPETGQSGLYYPHTKDQPIRSDLALIYTSGLLLGAMVDDSLKTMMSNFMADAAPGSIDTHGNPFGREDAAFRVYKIGTDDSLLNGRDYQEWPVTQGAPVDESGNPLLLGDQTLWCSFTDGYPYPKGHRNGRTQPLGAEVHMTVYGWGNLDNIIFIRWEIINKSKEYWKDTYVGIFADCELGGAGDDLVGSDSSLALVYDYNGDEHDEAYRTILPTVGYVFLQTPRVPSPGDSAIDGKRKIAGYRNLPAKAPLYYKHGLHYFWDTWGEFYMQTTRGSQQAYLRMQGLNEKHEPLINPITGAVTDWALSGDPVSGTGWIDQQIEDRRFLLSSGPFDMAPGDTQTVAIAIVVGQGRDRLDSITKLKRLAPIAHGVYRYDGILSVEDSWADPTDRAVSIPIGLTNLQESALFITFDVLYDPTALSLEKALPTFRTENCDIQIQSLSAGHNRITITCEDNRSLIGVGPIVQLTGKLSQHTPVGKYPIQLYRLIGFGNKYGELQLTDLSGSVHVTHSPSVIRLLGPPNDGEIQGMQIQFSWSQATDADNDSLTYQFYWVGEEYPFYKTTDAAFRFNGSEFFRGDTSYSWTLSVFAGQKEYASPDTFILRVPALDKLSHVRLQSQFTLEPSFKWARQILAEGDFLYVATYGSGKYSLYVVQLADPMTPRLIRSFPFPGDLQVDWMTVRNGILYCLGNVTVGNERRAGFAVIRVEWPDKISQVYGEHLYQAEALQPQGDKLYILCQGEKVLRLYSISDPLSPLLIRQIPTTFDIFQRMVAISDSFVYLAGGPYNNYTFDIYKLTPSYELEKQSSIPIPSWQAGLLINENLAYVLNRSDNEYWGPNMVSALRVIDISHPDAPIVCSVTSVPFEGYSNSLTAYGRWLWWGKPSQLNLFDVSDPHRPLQVGFSKDVHWPLTVNGPWAYGVQENRVYVARMEGLIDAVEGGKGVNEFRVYQNYPNPFNQGTTIAFSLARPGMVEIDIFDILGRHAVTIKREPHAAGSYIVRWDGKDHHGIPCAAGLYFCRVKAGDQVQIKKMIKLP